MSETMAQMNEEQKWAFELDGYILLPNLLCAAAAARATPTALAEHTGLLAAIDQLAGGQVPLWYRAAYDGTEDKEQAFHVIQFAVDQPPGRLIREGQWANDLTVDEQRRARDAPNSAFRIRGPIPRLLVTASMDDRPGLCHDDVLHHSQPQRSGRTAAHGAGQHRLAASRRRDCNG